MVKAPELGYANIGMVMLIEKKKKRDIPQPEELLLNTYVVFLLFGYFPTC